MDRFSATSSGKVFFETFGALKLKKLFSRIKLVTKNDLAPRKGLLLGLCFVAEGSTGLSSDCSGSRLTPVLRPLVLDGVQALAMVAVGSMLRRRRSYKEK